MRFNYLPRHHWYDGLEVRLGDEVDVVHLTPVDQREPVQDVEVLLAEEHQPLRGVQPLDAGGPVHVRDLLALLEQPHDGLVVRAALLLVGRGRGGEVGGAGGLLHVGGAGGRACRYCSGLLLGLVHGGVKAVLVIHAVLLGGGDDGLLEPLEADLPDLFVDGEGLVGHGDVAVVVLHLHDALGLALEHGQAVVLLEPQLAVLGRRPFVLVWFVLCSRS